VLAYLCADLYVELALSEEVVDRWDRYRNHTGRIFTNVISCSRPYPVRLVSCSFQAVLHDLRLDSPPEDLSSATAYSRVSASADDRVSLRRQLWQITSSLIP
jgi:hypothetical protein